MTEAEIYPQLTDIFHEVFDDEDIVLGPETTAADIEDWDSFNHINIVVASETRFGIRIDTAEVETMKNVGEFVQMIAQKTS